MTQSPRRKTSCTKRGTAPHPARASRSPARRSPSRRSARTPTTSWPQKPLRRPKPAISTRADSKQESSRSVPKALRNMTVISWVFYMRARHGLALALLKLGEEEEAMEHFRAMLKLNPGDNQGIRYLLLGCLLRRDDAAAVKKLLAAYEDEWSACWLYTRALVAFREGHATEQREPAPAAVATDDLDPPNLSCLRLRHKLKSRHKPIS